MAADLRLLCVLAHPDDEALGCGFTLAKYAAEGVRTHLVCATRGERGWQGPPEEFPGLEALGRIRERELLDSAMALGISEVDFLDYIDGEVDQANPGEAIGKIVRLVRRIRPQVVITFDPLGAYGHPDHIAIQQYCQAALVAAADASYAGADGPPHRVSKLYYMADLQPLVDAVAEMWGIIDFDVDGQVRHHTAWPDWGVTTAIDCAPYWETGLDAIACHVTQTADLMDGLRDLPARHDIRIFTTQYYYRAYSLVNGGRKVETDLFEGLR